MERMRLISMYAALHVLVMCGFNQRSLSKMKPRLRAISENLISVLQKRNCMWELQSRIGKRGGCERIAICDCFLFFRLPAERLITRPNRLTEPATFRLPAERLTTRPSRLTEPASFRLPSERLN